MARTIVKGPLTFTAADGTSIETYVSSFVLVTGAGAGYILINSNRITQAFGDSTPFVYRDGTPTYTADQYFSLTLLLIDGTQGRAGGSLRVSADIGGNADWYAVTFDDASNESTVWKCVNGSISTLDIRTSVAWANGDNMIGEAISNGADCDINVYRNGTLAYTVTDSSSPLTTGKPGFYSRQVSSYTVGIDDLEMGTVSAADTTAPTLTSPTGAATGIDTADGSVSSDEGGGTLYAVATISGTAPSVAQIQAGQDNSSAGATYDTNQAVSGTGTQNVAATGLVPGTSYYWHYQHKDAAGNDSTVVSSASFTTDAIGTITLLPMKNNSGMLLTSKTVHLSIVDALTANPVLVLLSQVTDAITAVLALTDAAFIAGTDYVVTTIDPSAVAGDPCGARIYTAT